MKKSLNQKVNMMKIPLSDQIDADEYGERLLNCPSYRPVTRDVDFLESSEGREARILAEFLKVEHALERMKIRSTVIVFGSARTPTPENARENLRQAEKNAKDNPDDEALRQAVKRAKFAVKNSKYYEQAREFGELVSRRYAKFVVEQLVEGDREVLRQSDFVVCTGGGPGIMEAANRGAFDAGAPSIGFSVSLPFEERPNPYVTPGLCFNFHYFSLRKFHFLLRAKALVAFPGGFGTFDELFEALTLRQSEKIQRLPIVLFGEEFWRKTVDFDYLIDFGLISPEDMNLFHFVKTAEEACDVIETFYKRQEEGTNK